MPSKKFGALFMVLSVILSSFLVSASLDIKKEEVSSMAIKELNLPAVFKLSLTNNGPEDVFQIYSLVGITLEPNESFSILHGDTKIVYLKLYPNLPLKVSPDYYSIEYKVKSSSGGIQTADVAFSIASLKDAFDIDFDAINPESETATLHFTNRAGHDLKDVKLEVYSELFSQSFGFDIDGKEEKVLEVNLNKEKMGRLLAGPYIVTLKITTGGVTSSTSAIINFNEKSGIQTSETRQGILLREYRIEKKNEGNTKTEVSVQVQKNIISSLFTSTTPLPREKDYKIFSVNYLFREELSPGESLNVIVRTNWWILIAIIIIIAVIWYAVNKYITNKIVIKKKVSIVRTKGGEFALRVRLQIKARDFVEKIRIIDRLPPMVKVFEKYGMIAPDKIDERTRSLEWNINALARGEERELSYIMYSKVGMVGKFEIPQAGVIYEYYGRIKEADSNRVFYTNEPVNQEE